MPKFVSEDEIDNLTEYHPPKDESTKAAHEHVRAMVRGVMHDLNDLLAESPQKTHLLRQVLPEVMMRANQVIAVHGFNERYFFEEGPSNKYCATCNGEVVVVGGMYDHVDQTGQYDHIATLG